MKKKKKNNISFTFGEVRETINTLTSIPKTVKTTNAPTAVAIQCLHQQEYFLQKNITYIITITKKKRDIQRC
jgi:hypothetical protein